MPLLCSTQSYCLQVRGVFQEAISCFGPCLLPVQALFLVLHLFETDSH